MIKEIKNLKIKETKMTNKEEIYIYIAVEEMDDIRDIYRRKAEVRRDDAVLRTYIPPQFYERFSALNKICRDRRLADPLLKTQVRFCSKDLEILTKEKGTEEPFEKIELKEFLGGDTIPQFDFKMKWKLQRDRPPRRVATSSRPASPERPERAGRNSTHQSY